LKETKINELKSQVTFQRQSYTFDSKKFGL